MEQKSASTVPRASPAAWLDSLPGDTETAEGQRTRGAAASTLTLLALSAVAAVAVPALFAVRPVAGAASVTTAVLVAMPFAFALSFLLVRAGWVWTSAGFSLATSAVAALVVSFTQPLLTAAASVGFMLAAVLVVGSLFLPFRIAAVLAGLNAAGAVLMPRFLPEAGTATLEVPYVFLAVNVVLFVAYAGLRQRELERLRRAEDKALRHETRVLELEQTTGELRDRHLREVADLRRTHKDHQAFLSAASHELRTPLTPILIQLSLLRGTSDGLSPAQTRHLDIIERNLDRLGVLVGDLLDVARIGSGKIVIQPQSIDLDDLIQDTLESFRSQADELGIQVDVAVQGPLRIEADPMRISQVLYNLLSNAVKFSPPGGRISILAHRDLDGAYVGIQDTGPGLSPAQIGALFKPFSQVHKPQASRPGTGLGLYISQGILTQHDGRIWAESDGPGRGSTFSFWLPRRVEASAELLDADESESHR